MSYVLYESSYLLYLFILLLLYFNANYINYFNRTTNYEYVLVILNLLLLLSIIVLHPVPMIMRHLIYIDNNIMKLEIVFNGHKYKLDLIRCTI